MRYGLDSQIGTLIIGDNQYSVLTRPIGYCGAGSARWRLRPGSVTRFHSAGLERTLRLGRVCLDD